MFVAKKSFAQTSSDIVNGAKEIFGPFQLFGPPNPMSIEAQALASAKSLIQTREGLHNPAGYDSENVLTGGIGHKITPADKVTYGQSISQAQIDTWFASDIAVAFNAAKSQAQQIKKYTAPMIAALTSVNFQLGTGWTSTFSNTWNSLRAGNIDDAINRLNQSKWKIQTPVRVADLVQTLQSQFG